MRKLMAMTTQKWPRMNRKWGELFYKEKVNGLGQVGVRKRTGQVLPPTRSIHSPFNSLSLILSRISTRLPRMYSS